MTKSKWIHNILGIVKYIADPNYQLRAWIKSEFDYPCHFEEIISKLYDDGDLNNFIDIYSQKFNLTAKQIRLLSSLRKKINAFSERKDIYQNDVNYKKIDEKKVINDPDWLEIQSIAKGVLDSFSSTDLNDNS